MFCKVLGMYCICHTPHGLWTRFERCMMTSSNGNTFRVTGLLCGEFTGCRWIPITKASDAELWRFLWSAHACINDWTNTREAGGLRRHRAHYDVSVMFCFVMVNWRLISPISLRVTSLELGKSYICPTASEANRKMWINNSHESLWEQDWMYVSWNALPLQWHHNERDGAWNHQPRDCLLSLLFRRRWKKHQISASLAFVRGIHRWPVNSLHKGQ